MVQWREVHMGWAAVARRTVVWNIDGRCCGPHGGWRFAGGSCSAPGARMSWTRALLLGWIRGLDTVATCLKLFFAFVALLKNQQHPLPTD